MLARNDLRQRFRGAVIGRLWLVMTPLISLLLYSLVFSTIFQARWKFMSADAYTDYAMVLFPGLMMHQLLIEVLVKGANAFDAYAGITSKLNIGFLDLVLGSALGSLIQFWMALAVWYPVAIWYFGISLSGLLMVLACLGLFAIFCVGLMLLSAVIGSLAKDWQQIISMLGMGLLFVSPILYPVTNLPIGIQGVVAVNPLTHYINAIRQGAFEPSLTFSFSLIGDCLGMAAIAIALGFWLQGVTSRFAND
ncbi:ABC transporter permease [Bradyrhizobium sp. BR13661]|jgi:lipopolysaccharide transport system permease protein|nr:ABC transporter permease [Bradyrhizobium sp. BR13661]MDH6264535.1 lipopolysaccharide transport system permease protein [Bradyrhizobium sp. BR13661]